MAFLKYLYCINIDVLSFTADMALDNRPNISSQIKPSRRGVGGGFKLYRIGRKGNKSGTF